jgi:hypothetical protein
MYKISTKSPVTNMVMLISDNIELSLWKYIIHKEKIVVLIRKIGNL